MTASTGVPSQNERVEAIRKAADALDRPRLAGLCDELIEAVHQREDAVDIAEAKRVLQILRRKRYFDLMQRVGDALIQAGPDTPHVRRQYAQALIDQGILTAAVAVLRDLVERTRDDRVEGPEAEGLLGRAFKQMYVNAAAPSRPWAVDALRRAVDTYHRGYLAEPSKHVWHGINAVACAMRAQADGFEIPGPEPRALARQILTEIENRGDEGSLWDLPTAMEALISLGDVAQAARYAEAYAAHPHADAFELGSTLRQLTEVWRLDTNSPAGAAVLPVLRNALLRRMGDIGETGRVELGPREVTQEAETALEKVLGHEQFVSLEWYRNGLERARAVARIGFEVERGHGTGFLVRGRDLHPRYGNDPVLLTNAHVLSRDASHRPAVSAGDAVICFHAVSEAGHPAHRCDLGEILWSSGPRELDTTIVRLENVPSGAQPYPVAAEFPGSETRPKLFIIGHPLGGPMSFSIYDNLLLGHNERLIHYRTPTEPGSSGSPVFNPQWKLVGIHHAGFNSVRRLDGEPGTYAANEGIRITAIQAALARELG